MRADIQANGGRGGGLQRSAVVVSLMRRRRVRGRLFSPSGRQVVIAVSLAVAAFLGLGMVTQKAQSRPLDPISWIGQ